MFDAVAGHRSPFFESLDFVLLRILQCGKGDVERMSDNNVTKRVKRKPTQAGDLMGRLAQRVVGQPQALDAIVPYVQMFQAGLSPEGRPVGVFLLLGPTGTGKTRTAEALAEVLHGSSKHILKVDCGEFQMEHEVAKLTGAPPGYLGHRETQPLLTQARLASVTTENCPLSIVLFDEIEKAAGSMARLLLGVLDKATLRLGDNNTVNFERSIILLTSNVGARGMMKEMGPAFGFAAERKPEKQTERLQEVATSAARKQFSPEFMNRVDATVTYQPLCDRSLSAILDQQICDMQTHIEKRLGERGFRLVVPPETRSYLLAKGASVADGAREIKRTLQRTLMQPLASLVAQGRVLPGDTVLADLPADGEGDDLVFRLAA